MAHPWIMVIIVWLVCETVSNVVGNICRVIVSGRDK